MLEQARRRQIAVADSAVNAALGALKKRFGEKQFRKQMTTSGQTEDEVRGYVREGMIIDSLMRMVMDIDSVTEAQCREYYDENAERFRTRGRVRARQILLRCDSSVSAEARAAKRELAAQLLKRARAGEDFATLAKAHSEGPNAKKGGDVSWFARGDLLAEIEQTAFELRKGETSDIVRSALGFHLVRKTGEEPPAQAAFADVADDIRKGLTLRRQIERLRSYTDSLLSAATVEYVDSTYAPSAM
jgi:parvulin-like peptidyl-prolyl isomerase